MPTDTERLDWLLDNTDAEFHTQPDGGQSLRFHLGPLASPVGLGGPHTAFGRTPRDCIDAAMAGRVEFLRGARPA